MKQKIKLLKDIVDNTPVPIAVYIDKELKIELANPAMIKTWGKGNNVIGKRYLELLPEIQKQQIFDQAINVLETGIPFHAVDEKVDLFIGGLMKTHYFNYSFIPLFDAEQKIYGIMNTGTDVTDLHLARQQAVNSDEKLRMTIESSDMGTYEIDLSTNKIKTSGNFNSIWSSDAETTNEVLIAKLHPEDLIVREKAHLEARITGKICYTARIVNDDKSLKWVKISGKIINDDNGIPVTTIGIIQDISDQKQFEEKLKKQVAENTEDLKRSNDDLLHFANVVSHDLREPVRKIKIFNNFLKNENEVHRSEILKKYIYKIDQSAKRMESIIEGILSYSTLNKHTQQIEKIDLNDIIEKTKTDLELVIKEKNAVLINCDLPEIEGAPILIHQLFYNLIHNALKFSKANQPPRILINCNIINLNNIEFAEIKIKDNGIGLDTTYNEKIFKAFERLHSKDQYEGNGLGLSLCKKIVLRHKGTISAFGEKDQGSEFTVRLPLIQKIKIL